MSRICKYFLLKLHLLGVVRCMSGSAVTKVGNGVYTCPLNPITAKYPDPSNKFCLYYFLCHRGHAFPRPCPIRQAFHPVKLECKKRDEIPEAICPFEIQCGFNGYVADPKDCTKYFLCFYRYPTHYSCSEGKVFNPATQTCISDTIRSKSCSKPTAPPHFSTTTKRSVRSIKGTSSTSPNSSNENIASTSPPPETDGGHTHKANDPRERIFVADPPEH